MSKLTACFVWLITTAAALGAADQAVYPDENRAPLGTDAQARVREMESNTFKRPHFRMPDAPYRAAWEKLRNQPIP